MASQPAKQATGQPRAALSDSKQGATCPAPEASTSSNLPSDQLTVVEPERRWGADIKWPDAWSKSNTVLPESEESRPEKPKKEE
jgi:hypothetical protein